MSEPLDGKRILMFVDDIYEDLELWYPKLRLLEAGAAVDRFFSDPSQLRLFVWLASAPSLEQGGEGDENESGELAADEEQDGDVPPSWLFDGD